jgi:hypothetical protein
MEEPIDVTDPSSEEVVENPKETPVVSEDVKTPDSATEEKAERTVPYERFKEVNDELARLKSKPKESKENSKVDALDFIKLGKKLQNYSDEELDFATKVAKSKSPDAILEALGDEMVQLAISSKREKVEKERTLKPSGKQTESDEPMSLEEALAAATSMSEKEEIMKQMGYSVENKHRADQVFRR